MYAIVDIETTGGYASHNRITEVAIILSTGREVTKRYETLINPGVPVPPYITGLTGITNQMLQGAPRFEEVAERIMDYLDGTIFVAHNVHFDYSFLKKEFSMVGLPFHLKKLCTVRLSRKLVPGLTSYGLGNLAKSLGVSIHDRHRAAGDADATVQIFHQLLERDTDHYILDYFKSHSKATNLPSNLPREEYEDLPEKAGVYYFHNVNGEVIYVGKAKDIKSRISGHFTGTGGSWGNANIRNDIHHITYELTGSELIAFLVETEEIKRLWPKYNKAGKTITRSWGIYSYTDQKGYIRLETGKNKKYLKPVVQYYSIHEAREGINLLIRENNLCPKLCGMQKVKEGCYDYQLGICNGACVEKEPAALYNERLLKALESVEESQETYLIVDRGREEMERSFVLVEKGLYRGYGYIPEDIPLMSIESAFTYLNEGKDTKEARQIINRHVQQGKAEVLRE
ncbi:MAG: exonuclease domain-containing protein [Cyclobacteriaceae bacterium]|nr:exonuclease domain-containing protein [Cyclobacteriaceae bacterium]